MRTWTRVLSTAVAVLMTGGMLAGCQGKEPSTSTTQTTGSILSTSASGETDQKTEVTETVASSQAGTVKTNGNQKTTTSKVQKQETTRRNPPATKKATTATQKPQETSAPKKLSDRKTSDIGFGYYGVAPDALDLDTTAFGFMKTDCVNTVLVGSNIEDAAHTLVLAKETNCRVWINIHAALFTGTQKLSGSWQKNFDAVDAAMRETGAYDRLLGYYLDEPYLCGISEDDFVAVTKYNHDKFGKRFFVCFAVSGVAPEVWKPETPTEVLNPNAARYLTDIAFDMYWDFTAENKKVYDQVIAKMKERAGRDDLYIWYVPCVMNASGTFSEQKAIAHLKGMYDYLKQEKHPGGLLGYTYRTSDGDGLGNIGLGEMGDKPWKSLENECARIGREICTGKMK